MGTRILSRTKCPTCSLMLSKGHKAVNEGFDDAASGYQNHADNDTDNPGFADFHIVSAARHKLDSGND